MSPSAALQNGTHSRDYLHPEALYGVDAWRGPLAWRILASEGALVEALGAVRSLFRSLALDFTRSPPHRRRRPRAILANPLAPRSSAGHEAKLVYVIWRLGEVC